MFRAEAKGRPLVLDNAGVVEGNEVFKDRGTGSRWQQSSLEAISGPLQGTHLQLYPFLLTSWQEWRRLHPDTLVLKPLPGYADRIADKNRMIRAGLSGEGDAPKDVTYHDNRLKPKTMVLGLDVNGSSKAFPLAALRLTRVVNDTLGGQPIVIVHQPTSDTTTAFVARAAGKALAFDAVNAEASGLVDRETGSHWDAYGACVSGALKGSTLEALVLEPEYWFAWSEFHRSTAIYAPSGTSALFIGNSFLFGSGSAVRFYRADTVTDLNNEGIGGVPALFKSFTQQAGLDYDVSLETRGGVGLDFHLANKLAVIGKTSWDTVVMHGYSTLDAEKPRDPAKLIATSKQMADALRARNPKVDLYLMATWSRADETYPAKGAWAGQPIEAMARDVRTAYDKAAAASAVKAVIPVGEAWTRAIQTGVADPNPYDGIDAGKLNLWTYDNYHASTHGYYLEALVIFGSVTGRDPRSLGPNECSAFELGLSRAEAKTLQGIAFDQLAAAGSVKAAELALTNSGTPKRCATGR